MTATKVASKGHGYEKTLQGIDASLQRMKFGTQSDRTRNAYHILYYVSTWTDYIDLFLIHDPLSGKQRRLETYKALLEAKAAGKIKSIGVSNLWVFLKCGFNLLYL